MSIQIYPVKIECIDTDVQALVFTVEAFDDVTASLEIKTVVCEESWAEISAAVRDALVMLRLGDQRDAPP